MFFAAPLRKHWQDKHRMTDDSNVVKKKKDKDKEEYLEAVYNSIAIFCADANIPAGALERKTLYNVGKNLHALFMRAGPSTKFNELFPDERLCGRKKLVSRLGSISLKLGELLR